MHYIGGRLPRAGVIRSPPQPPNLPPRRARRGGAQRVRAGAGSSSSELALAPIVLLSPGRQ